MLYGARCRAKSARKSRILGECDNAIIAVSRCKVSGIPYSLQDQRRARPPQVFELAGMDRCGFVARIMVGADCLPCNEYQARRTQIGRPSSNIRLSALTAILTSHTRRASSRKRNASPITACSGRSPLRLSNDDCSRIFLPIHAPMFIDRTNV
jgi:hypothetical protein